MASQTSIAQNQTADFTSVDDWLEREALSYSTDAEFNAAVDKLMGTLGEEVQVLGFGEPIHSGDEFLTLRNRLFQRLVEAHGFSAITLETNDMRARLIDDYVAGRGAATYEEIQNTGFTFEIGRWPGNRELVEWMRQYNADPARAKKLNFYGTLASDQETTKSPRDAIELALGHLASIDPAAAARQRELVEPLLGADSDWEDSAAAIAKEIMVQVLAGGKTVIPSGQEIGVSPRARALRLAVDDLAAELRIRRPELIAGSDRDSFGEALRHLTVARNLLDLHAALARRESLDTLVSMRDAMAAEHIAYIVERERPRGRVMVFLHSVHLRRTRAKLPWYEFWPTGAHLDQMLGERFAVVGGALGTSEDNSVGEPEAGSLEARLLACGADSFVPTSRGRRLLKGALAALPQRTGSTRPDIPYTPLFEQSIVDVDAIAFLRSVTYTRGATPLPS